MASAIVGTWVRARPGDGGLVAVYSVAYLADDGSVDLDEVEVTVLPSDSGPTVEGKITTAVRARAEVVGHALPANAAVLLPRVARG